MASEGIGARLPRKEDRRFITGAGNYTDDIAVKNAAHSIPSSAKSAVNRA